MNKKVLGLGLAAVAALSLVACGSRDKSASTGAAKTDLKVAVVTDTGGVDDKSFNQSAWEGLQKWGKANGLSKDNGFTYYQSASESDYVTNFDSAISSGYKLIYGVGFALHDAVVESAKHNENVNYVLIDDVITDQKNVFSATFMDNEAAYLAGVAAAKTTKTNKVGFVGGMEGEVLKRFEVGFKEGVASVNPKVTVDVQYVGSFSDAAKGKTVAAAQYKSGADIIFQAAGGTGAGVFSEAKALNEGKNEADKVWVLGVDRDQKAEGNYQSKDGKKANFVLASTLKKVGQVVETVSKDTAAGKFKGGTHVSYGIKDGSVDLINDNLSDDAAKAVDKAREAIKAGEIKVPEK
ncbi:MAG: BMP family protein [Streptococcaceae bacterium]|jgi:basic membrane protein A|nr:BMP family protein [Streptococcaceae bacterium]